MVKNDILSKYIKDQKILHIISHHWRVYVRLIIKYLLLLMIGFVGYWSIHRYISWSFINVVFGVYGLFLYVAFVVGFMDLYLDSLVLTDQGINLFFWEGLFKYSNELLEWESIETVYDDQEGLLDLILGKGNIKIKRAEEQYIFDNISHPSEVSALIMSVKDEIVNQEKSDQNQGEVDKFQLLVEALGEIIKEFYSKR